jgi:acetyl esterase/lipase
MNRVPALLAAALLSACFAAAESTSCSTQGTDNAFLGIQTINLWPGTPPQAKGNRCEDIPTLTILSPRQGTENGSAVVIFPGGSYQRLAADLEGREVADWFTARGFKAFIVAYRLSSNGYLLPVPLLDARRAIQTVRARATEYHVASDRIVALGFSAGGHLVALAATKPVSGDPGATDPVERVSSRPDYLVLGYPWLGAITTDTSHLSYCKLFNVMDRCEALRAEYTPELFVSKDTPPTFIYHTFNDRTVPVEQVVPFFNALLKAGVSSEMHIFASGNHGSGLGKGDPALEQWPTLLDAWLRAQGLLKSSF